MRRSSPDWEGAVALVTGASSGIGAAVAQMLGARGLRVVLTGRRQDRLRSLQTRIVRAGGEACAIPADLAQEADRVRLLRNAQAAFGPVSVLVNNAGFGWYGWGHRMPWPLACQMIQVNLAAAVQLTLSALPSMLNGGRGHVINIGSIAGSLPSQGVAVYASTKSFLDSFSTAMHRELRGSGVHLSVIRPGPVASEFFARARARPGGGPVPAERFAVPAAAVARAVWSTLRRPRRVLYVPGLLAVTPWVEMTLGWLFDLLGPLGLRRTRTRTGRRR